MKEIIFFITFVACAFCLFGGCKLESEVLGAYNVIESFNKQNLFHHEPNVNHTQQIQQNHKQLYENQEVYPEAASTISPPSITPPQASVSRVPLFNYNTAVARKIGLSTLMMSGVLYGLTMLPALIALTGAGGISGFFSSLGRRKRSLVNESHIFRQMPLLDNEETVKFLTLFESTLQARKIINPICKHYYTCKVYYNVIKSGEHPTLATFENAILNVFGIVVERKDIKIPLVPTVKMYYSIAKNAIDGKNCALRYPCSLFPNQQYTKVTSF